MLGILFWGICGCSQNTDIYLDKYEENVSEITEDVVEEVEQNSESISEELQQLCYVYICGAVVRPGVYALPQGSRIYEAIELAGGLSKEADDTFINQAEVVTDEMMIRVYTKEETEAISVNNTNQIESDMTDGRVNVNTASVSELMTLPGIGTAKAEAIVSYRKENGEFSDIEELMNVPGIKEGIFQQMKEHIKVN